jgi:hypothetical protein
MLNWFSLIFDQTDKFAVIVFHRFEIALAKPAGPAVFHKSLDLNSPNPNGVAPSGSPFDETPFGFWFILHLTQGSYATLG